MAAPNHGPPPIRIEYPPNTHKRDAPTGGGAPQPAITPAQETILQAAIAGPLPANPDQNLISLSPAYGVLCYRNAVLGLLFNLKPFVNLLEQAANDHPQPEQALILLRDLSNRYWSIAAGSDAQRRADLQGTLAAWFNEVCQNGGAHGSSWDVSSGMGQQGDVDEFCRHLINRACYQEYSPDHAAALRAMFQIQQVSRTAYVCGCKEKLRQPNDEYLIASNAGLWIETVTADASFTPLASLLTTARYTTIQAESISCPTCGAQNATRHEYNKYARLPEVFLVGVGYPGTVVDPETRARTWVSYDDRNNTDQPDRLDLSFLQDYPPTSQQATMNGSIYELRSVVAYSSDGAGGRAGHYKLHVRRQNNTWTTVNDYATPEVSNGRARLSLKGKWRARLLAYVRVHDSPTSQPVQGSIPVSKPQNAPVGTVSGTQADPTQGRASISPLTPTQSMSQLGAAPLPPPNPSVQPQPNQTAATTSPVPDATNWSSDRIITELKSRHVNVHNFKSKDKLLDLWNRYHAASPYQKLDFLSAAGLRAQAAALNINGLATNAKKNQMLTAIRRQMTTLSTATAAPTDATNVVDTQLQTTVNQLTAQNVQDQNLIMMQQQTIRQLNITNAAQQAEIARLQGDLRRRNTEVGDLNRRLGISDHRRNALATSLQDANNMISDLQGSQGATQASSGTFRATSSQGSQTQQDGIQRTSQRRRTSPRSPASQMQTSSGSTQRVLRVTTFGVVDAIEIDPDTGGNVWKDDVKYIGLPAYLANHHLTTASWFKKEHYLRNGGTTLRDGLWRIRVWVSCKSQVRARATVYTWDIELGPALEADMPWPQIDIELLDSNAASAVRHRVDRGVTLFPAHEQSSMTMRPSATPPKSSAATGSTQNRTSRRRPRDEDENDYEKGPDPKRVRFNDNKTTGQDEEDIIEHTHERSDHDSAPAQPHQPPPDQPASISVPAFQPTPPRPTANPSAPLSNFPTILPTDENTTRYPETPEELIEFGNEVARRAWLRFQALQPPPEPQTQQQTKTQQQPITQLELVAEDPDADVGGSRLYVTTGVGSGEVYVRADTFRNESGSGGGSGSGTRSTMDTSAGGSGSAQFSDAVDGMDVDGW